jgi:NADPH:quinone reductase-like Zn-dependent oxidoreductase
VELVGGDTTIALLDAVKTGGLLISAQFAWAPSLKAEADKRGVRTSWYLVEPDYVGLEVLTGLIERGALKVEVSATYPFERAVMALQELAHRRTVGKVVLTM